MFPSPQSAMRVFIKGFFMKRTILERHKETVIIGLFVLLIVLVDRVTKIIAASLSQPVDLGLFMLRLVINTGASFGILKGMNLFFIIISVLVLGVLAFYYGKIPKVSLVLITGGVIGNLADRIFLGHVIDFIDFGFFPVFNIADSAITIGVLIWLILILKKKA